MLKKLKAVFWGLKMKYAYLFIAAALAPACLFATQKPITESAQGTFSGDYVVYRDYSWKAPTWIGFLYYDDETYGAFIHTPEKNGTISILFSGKPENGALTLTGQQIISPVTPEDTLAVNYLMTLLPKLYELRVWPQAKKALYGKATVRSNIEEFGGAVDLHFHSFIPLFHLNALTGAKSEPILELVEMGSIKESGEASFYGYTPAETKSGTNKFKVNKTAKKETVIVQDISFYLDSQWKKVADNAFLCGDTAFLTVNVIRLPPAESGASLSEHEQLLRFLTSSGAYTKVLLPYMSVEGSPKLFTLNQSVYDVELKKITKSIKRCVKNKDGSFTVISLTVDSYAYNAEKSYFDRLF